MIVNEGPRVYIENINIINNTRTVDRVIRRKLIFQKVMLIISILLNIPKFNNGIKFFSDVNIESLRQQS